MSVFEHRYKPYSGELTASWSRFLIIPRYAYQTLFKSKFFLAFFLFCFACPLVMMILIYLRHNPTALKIMELQLRDLFVVDTFFFLVFVYIQAIFALIMTVLIGPNLISTDLSNNALPLYLCRPFSKTEYVLGKMSVLLLLLSCITWVPGLMLFFFQSYLEGFKWFTDHWRIGFAIFSGFWIWIICLALLSLAISALVKWRLAASAALFGMVLIPSAFASIVNNAFSTKWGDLISLWTQMMAVMTGLFGVFEREAGHLRRRVNGQIIDIVIMRPPLWTSWLAIALTCAVCLWLLRRKIRAYEVVR